MELSEFKISDFINIEGEQSLKKLANISNCR